MDDMIEEVLTECSLHGSASDLVTVDGVVLLLENCAQVLNDHLSINWNSDDYIHVVLRELDVCIRQLLVHWNSKLLGMQCTEVSLGRPKKHLNIELVSTVCY